MALALIGLALAMIAGGVYAAYDGYAMIVLERGWALTIAGATVAGLGAVLLGVAVAALRLGQIRKELVLQRDRPVRPEPAGRADPVFPVSPGPPEGARTPPSRPDPVLSPPPVRPASPAVAPDVIMPVRNPVEPMPRSEPELKALAELSALFPDPGMTERDRARAARREETAQRRGPRSGGEDGPERPSAGTLAAGAAAALAAGAALSAGLAAVRKRPAAADVAVETRAAGMKPALPQAEPLRLPDHGSSEPPGATVPAAFAATGEAGVPSFPPHAFSPDDTVPGGPPFAAGLEIAPDAAADGAPAVIGTYNSGGNHYIMFSDGAIDAETPDGRFRFGSLDELKTFIASGGEAPAKA